MNNIPEWLIRYRNWSIEAMEEAITTTEAVAEAILDFLRWVAPAIAFTYLILMAVLLIIAVVDTICERIRTKINERRTPSDEGENNGLEDLHEE